MNDTDVEISIPIPSTFHAVVTVPTDTADQASAAVAAKNITIITASVLSSIILILVLTMIYCMCFRKSNSYGFFLIKWAAGSTQQTSEVEAAPPRYSEPLPTTHVHTSQHQQVCTIM
ncbi:hypothetical protein HDU97_008573 [Phlyctochytrium planicorne]|nr:hypothetical protein HDU97_008573 [Phlyctochytrium planicorne]